MFEGELKKRIRNCIPDYFKQTDEDNAITWALDEAKKDFPKIDFAKPTQFAYEVNERIKAILTWKKRWLGEST